MKYGVIQEYGYQEEVEEEEIVMEMEGLPIDALVNRNTLLNFE